MDWQIYTSLGRWIASKEDMYVSAFSLLYIIPVTSLLPTLLETVASNSSSPPSTDILVRRKICSSCAKLESPCRLYVSVNNSNYITFFKLWGNSQCWWLRQEYWKQCSHMIDQWTSPLLKLQRQIPSLQDHHTYLFFTWTLFSLRYEENDIICLVNPC